jgi:hypothetical protein
MNLSATMRAAIVTGFEAQATAHGADVHRRAVDMRSRDPLATFLWDTFSKQVRKRGAEAMAAQERGERALAVAKAHGAEMAAGNLRRLKAAIEGDD